MGSFGEPVQGAPGAPGGNGGETSAAAAPDVSIDPNDPRLVSEALEVNVEADAYATPPLPIEGRYRLKLKHEGVKNDKGEVLPYHVTSTKRDHTPYFETAISATILDPTGKFDGIRVYPAFGGTVGTLVNRDGSTKVGTILNRLVRPDGEPWAKLGLRMSQKDWMELFVRALAGEPEIGGELQWEWSCQRCGEEAKAAGKPYPRNIQGMTRFPAETDKNKRLAGFLFSPEMKCAVNAGHGYSRGQARIAGFLRLSELPQHPAQVTPKAG